MEFQDTTPSDGIFPTQNGALRSIARRRHRFLRSILAVESPEPTNESSDRNTVIFRRYLWSTDGQGYEAEATVQLSNMWEYSFLNPPVYTTSPAKYIHQEIDSIYYAENQTRYCEIPFLLQSSEECGPSGLRAWALLFRSEYTSGGEVIVPAGSTVPIMFRQKKFDYSCRLFVEIYPKGLLGKIFAVFEDIRGVIEMPNGAFFQGPLIVGLYLEELLRGRFGLYKPNSRRADSEEYLTVEPLR